MAAATGRHARVGQHTRLFELGDLVEPRPVAGRLRPATLDEQPLVASWYDAFMVDADEQAGREPGESPHESPTEDDMRRRIDGGRVFVWVDDVRAAGPRDRREPAVVRRLADRARSTRRASSAVAATPAPPSHAVSMLLRDSGERPACSPTRPTRRRTRSTRRSATGGSSTWRISAWSDGSIEWSRHERRPGHPRSSDPVSPRPSPRPRTRCCRAGRRRGSSRRSTGSAPSPSCSATRSAPTR